MSELLPNPGFLVSVLLLAAAIGGVIGFMLRGWYDEARRDASSTPGQRSDRPVPRGTAVLPTTGPRPRNSGRPATPVRGLDALKPPLPGSDRPLVLLVDDRLELLALHGSYLHRHGYGVLTAEDGDAALELALSHRPAVIVLDHTMPGRTGVEVARELKRRPETAAIPLVMMTAHSYGALGGLARDAGFSAFLTKPVDPGRMLRQVEELLAGPAA